MDTKAFKRSLHSSENYHRKGFGHEAEVASQLESEYQSNLIQEIRDRNYRLQRERSQSFWHKPLGFAGVLSELSRWRMKPVNTSPPSASGLPTKLFIIPQ